MQLPNFRFFDFRPPGPKIKYFAPFKTDHHFNAKFPNLVPLHFAPQETETLVDFKQSLVNSI